MLKHGRLSCVAIVDRFSLFLPLSHNLWIHLHGNIRNATHLRGTSDIPAIQSEAHNDQMVFFVKPLKGLNRVGTSLRTFWVEAVCERAQRLWKRLPLRRA